MGEQPGDTEEPWRASVGHVRDSGSLFPQDRLEHLRKQCGPHVSAAAKDSVEGICSKIYYISLEYVKRIREKHLAILKENNISGTQSALKSCRAAALQLKACPCSENVTAGKGALSPKSQDVCVSKKQPVQHRPQLSVTVSVQ